ncbi:MAG: hypothetical protein ACXAB4_09910 [Candidatus Hodarchaeales archaeon]
MRGKGVFNGPRDSLRLEFFKRVGMRTFFQEKDDILTAFEQRGR